MPRSDPGPQNRRYLVAPPRRRLGRLWIAVGVLVLTAATVAAAVGALALQNSRSTEATPTGVEDRPAPIETRQDVSLTTTASDRTLRLELPATGSLRGLVVFFPDRSTDAEAALASAPALALRASGWAVADIDGSGEDWGSPVSTERVSSLLQWAADQAVASPLVFVSAGTGAATSIAAMGRSDGAAPACWLGIDPVTDLEVQAGADAGVRSEIARAWRRFPEPAELPRTLAAAAPTTTQYRLLESARRSDEVSVEIAADIAALDVALRDSGHDVQTVAVAGTGTAGLVSIAQACAR